MVPDSHRRPVQDEEERRLLATVEACHAAERAAVDSLLHPPEVVLNSTYRQSADRLSALQEMYKESRLALIGASQEDERGRQVERRNLSSGPFRYVSEYFALHDA